MSINRPSLVFIYLFLVPYFGVYAQHSFSTNQATSERIELHHLFDFSVQNYRKIDLGISPLVYDAFFCKIENKIEKQSNVPFRFRLGNLDYVNRLENKK
ncbi:MAG: hypothetical protein WAT79_07335 [Saprospiraceae bacterium]